MPANGESVSIPVQPTIRVDMQKSLLKKRYAAPHDTTGHTPKRHRPQLKVNNESPVDGFLMMKGNSTELKLLDAERVSSELNLDSYILRFTSSISLPTQDPTDTFFTNLAKDLEERFPECRIEQLAPTSFAIDSVLVKLHTGAAGKERKASASGSGSKDLLVSWRFDEEELGSRILRFLKPPATSPAKQRSPRP